VAASYQVVIHSRVFGLKWKSEKIEKKIECSKELADINTKNKNDRMYANGRLMHWNGIREPQPGSWKPTLVINIPRKKI
jgi:hypothetical protein